VWFTVLGDGYFVRYVAGSRSDVASRGESTLQHRGQLTPTTRP